MELKPEITAPGGSIYSVDGSIPGGKAYELMSGTSMAAPQVAGMAALAAQYIRANKLDEKTGLTVRALSQSLLMSTATPLLEEDSGFNYYPVLRQGAGPRQHRRRNHSRLLHSDGRRCHLWRRRWQGKG